MPLYKLILTAILLPLLLAGDAVAGEKKNSINWNEQRLKAIDAELETLSGFSLRSGTGAIGFQSNPHKNNTPEWVQVDLKKETPIDQIVLVPCIQRDAKSGLGSAGFPQEFRIVSGSGSDTNGTPIASFGAEDQLLPRIAPLSVPCAVTASWIRVEASVLSPRAWDGKYDLKLAELLVFNGSDNVALHQPVDYSSQNKIDIDSRKARFLVDGFVPYLMAAFHGEQSIAFATNPDLIDRPILSVDLGKTHRLNRLHLHAVDLSNNIPQSTPANFGMPKQLVMEGANRPDFSDAVRLVEYRRETDFDTGPILMFRFDETPCRYVRLIAVKPYIGSWHKNNIIEEGPQIGFAEIELFAGGQNVALGKRFSGNFKFTPNGRSFAALTDGRNRYGNILSIREWLNQLARRHELETERPIIEARLANLYARQKTHLRRMTWLAVLLAVGTVITLLVEKVFRLRAIYQTRERIAANLHDELGANLNAIGLLGDYAQNLINEAGKQEELLELSEIVSEVRDLTEETGETARHCTNLLEAKGHHEDLIDDINRTSTRLLADIEHEIIFNHESALAELSHRKRIDLALFYKECLNNIVRHTEATKVITKITGTPSCILLTIQDNGHGLSSGSKPSIPASLKRRAKLAGGKVQATTPPEGGTLITLRIRTHHFFGNTQKTD